MGEIFSYKSWYLDGFYGHLLVLLAANGDVWKDPNPNLDNPGRWCIVGNCDVRMDHSVSGVLRLVETTSTRGGRQAS